ncbi:MAG: hypothetical protein ACN6OY_07230, partial [Pseudomonas alloputida]
WVVAINAADDGWLHAPQPRFRLVNNAEFLLGGVFQVRLDTLEMRLADDAALPIVRRRDA